MDFTKLAEGIFWKRWRAILDEKSLMVQTVSFSNELFCILPPKGATKVPDVKVWCLKKWSCPGTIESDLLNEISIESKISDFF